MISLFEAPRPIEAVSVLPVRNYGSGTPNAFPVRIRFAHVYVPDCRPGDVLDIAFAMQATNDLGYNVELAGRLFWTTEPTGIDGLCLTGVGGRAFNITPAMHHGPFSLAARHCVKAPASGFVAAMIYAGGGTPSQPGDAISVDIGYGDFSVVRHRNGVA